MKTDDAKRLLHVSEENFVDNLNEALWKVYSKNEFIQVGMNAVTHMLENFRIKVEDSKQLQPSVTSICKGSRAAFPLGFGHAVKYVKPGVALIG